jgi:hypothetical protein
MSPSREPYVRIIEDTMRTLLAEFSEGDLDIEWHLLNETELT